MISVVIFTGMKELINTHSIDKDLINSNYKVKERINYSCRQWHPRKA